MQELSDGAHNIRQGEDVLRYEGGYLHPRFIATTSQCANVIRYSMTMAPYKMKSGGML